VGDAGFDVDTNAVTIVGADGAEALPLQSKSRVAAEILNRVEKLLASNPVVQLSGSFEDGEAMLEVAYGQQLEGVMAKRSDSRYQEGKRNREWLKIKTHGR